MALSGSSKELARAIKAVVESPSLALPDELNQVIAAYLEKHEKPNEASSDRLNDELVSVYQKHVDGRPERYAAFLAILRSLQPVARTSARMLQWWDRLIEPVLDNLNHERGLAKEAMANVLELLSFKDEEVDPPDAESTKQNVFAVRLLHTWLRVQHAAQTGDSSSTEIKERMLREAINRYGKMDPKSFMIILDDVFVKKEHRNSSLHLLCDFIQAQPPHLHLILQTPLFGNMLKSLQLDDSTATISLAVVTLIMLLPHMPSSLVPFLPTLFNIYARLLFWDRDRSFAQEHAERDAGSPHPSGNGELGWEKCVFNNDLDGNTVPYLATYFTILYGLFPINFVDYIRKPQRYLRHANNAEDVDVQAMEIRDRSEQFRQSHLLHPNFYTLTIETEKTDFSRWLKSEAADVTVEAMALCRATPLRLDGRKGLPGATSPASNEVNDHESQDPDLLSDSAAASSSNQGPKDAEQNQLLARVPDSSIADPFVDLRRISDTSNRSQPESLEAIPPNAGADSPTLPPHLVPSSSHLQLQDMIQSNKMIKTGLHQSLANDSVPSLALSHADSVPERNFLQLQAPPRASSPAISSEMGARLARFHRQNLLLQNDLNFERYMKQQHTTHVGMLRRKQLRHAATEAETQNLIMANRSLKHRLDEAKRAELQIKKESDNRRNMSKKWEGDLSAKLKALREEQKKWDAKEQQLTTALEAAKAECEKLNTAVLVAARDALQKTQDAEVRDIGLGDVERLKAELSRLSSSERRYQGMERMMQKATQDGEAAVDRAEKLAEDLATRETQLVQACKTYESQILQLNAQLEEAMRDHQHRRNSDESAMFETALAASRAKQSEMQKQYALLDRKYKTLQSSLFDLQTDAAERRNLSGKSSMDSDSHAASVANARNTEPLIGRSRSRRGLSDPEEPAPSHGTPPSEHPTGVQAGSYPPATPPQGGQADPASASSAKTPTSSQNDRYYGRGGVQNIIRKDRRDSGKKEDKPEKPEKKEKKTSGIQRIRGFV